MQTIETTGNSHVNAAEGNCRRHFTGEQKVAILREHLLDKTPLSDLCQKHRIHVSQFYAWQKSFFENGAAALEGDGRRRSQLDLGKKDAKIAALEDKLKRKDEVIAELLEDHVAFKKSLGEI